MTTQLENLRFAARMAAANPFLTDQEADNYAAEIQKKLPDGMIFTPPKPGQACYLNEKSNFPKVVWRKL